MNSELESLFKIHIFTTGRFLFAMRQTQKLATQHGFTELAQHCEASIAHGVATIALERRWDDDSKKSDSNPAAQKIDVLVDRVLGAIRDGAEAQAQGAPEGDPIHEQVKTFVKRVFPSGVHAVTSLAYVEELAVVEAIVGLLKGELASTVGELGLTTLASRLATLAVQYSDALEAPPPSLISWGHVRAARAESQGLLVEALSLLVGKYHKRTPEGVAERGEMLAPIMKQNEAIAAFLRARRAVADVDPETGEEDPAAPGGKDVAPEGGTDTGNNNG